MATCESAHVRRRHDHRILLPIAARAIAILDRTRASLQIDGADEPIRDRPAPQPSFCRAASTS